MTGDNTDGDKYKDKDDKAKKMRKKMQDKVDELKKAD